MKRLGLIKYWEWSKAFFCVGGILSLNPGQFMAIGKAIYMRFKANVFSDRKHRRRLIVSTPFYNRSNGVVRCKESYQRFLEHQNLFELWLIFSNICSFYTSFQYLRLRLWGLHFPIKIFLEKHQWKKVGQIIGVATLEKYYVTDITKTEFKLRYQLLKGALYFL